MRSFVAGTALASKIDGYNNKHLALLGDAECTAGSVWEAASFISYEKLNNVIAIVDFNKIGKGTVKIYFESGTTDPVNQASKTFDSGNWKFLIT